MTTLSVLNISWNGYHVGPGQIGSTFALLPYACALDCQGVVSTPRFIALWGRNLTLMHCRSKHTIMVVTSLLELIFFYCMHGTGVVSAMEVKGTSCTFVLCVYICVCVYVCVCLCLCGLELDGLVGHRCSVSLDVMCMNYFAVLQWQWWGALRWSLFV